MWVVPVSKDTLQILSSGNIKIAFNTPSFVGTSNFMHVACLVWPNNFKHCYLS